MKNVADILEIANKYPPFPNAQILTTNKTEAKGGFRKNFKDSKT